MRTLIVPCLSETEPFEVAIGGNQVTACTLTDSQSGKTLAPGLLFKKFLQLSPLKDFSILVSWRSARDEFDFGLDILDNLTGKLNSLGPIHSLPTDIEWMSEFDVEFKVKVRPSISKLPSDSKFDLAKNALVSVSKIGDKFQIIFKSKAP